MCSLSMRRKDFANLERVASLKIICYFLGANYMIILIIGIQFN